MVLRKIRLTLITSVSFASIFYASSREFGDFDISPSKRASLPEGSAIDMYEAKESHSPRFPGFYPPSGTKMKEQSNFFKSGNSIEEAFRLVGHGIQDLSFVQRQTELSGSTKITDLSDQTIPIIVIKTGIRPNIGVFYSKSWNGHIYHYLYPVFAYQLEGCALLISKVHREIVIFKIQHYNIVDLLKTMKQELEEGKAPDYNGHVYGISKGILCIQDATLRPYDRVSVWIKDADPKEYLIPREILEGYLALPAYDPRDPTEWRGEGSGTFLQKITRFIEFDPEAFG
jgi:hypothetical protein